MISKLAIATVFVQQAAADAGFTQTTTASASAHGCADCILAGREACVDAGAASTVTDTGFSC